MTGLFQKDPEVSSEDPLAWRRRHDGTVAPSARRIVVLNLLARRSPSCRAAGEASGLEGGALCRPGVAVEYVSAHRMSALSDSDGRWSR